ncbi:MAG: hypothetical protein QME14_04935 [Methanobacteriaceae archaeon]|nr:hypothetical protein [Methanobacteriaceae archaeon]
MRLKCKICGRDIGSESPEMTCWICYNKKLKKDEIRQKKAEEEAKIKRERRKIIEQKRMEVAERKRAKWLAKSKLEKKKKAEKLEHDMEKVAMKLFNENRLRSEKILLFIEPYLSHLQDGITRPKLSFLLGINPHDCKVILTKLIMDGKAYKTVRFFKNSIYYLKKPK